MIVTQIYYKVYSFASRSLLTIKAKWLCISLVRCYCPVEGNSACTGLALLSEVLLLESRHDKVQGP